MAYEKQTWTTGEVITADKLNHMEEGIAAGENILNVTFSGEPTNFPAGVVYFGDHTAQEVLDTFNNGGIVLFRGVPGEDDTEVCGIVKGIDTTSKSISVYMFTDGALHINTHYLYDELSENVGYLIPTI